VSTIDATPVPELANLGLPAPATQGLPRRRSRNGKIARLPKHYRDLVNRMLSNNVPLSKIVGALDEFEILVTARNISNWKNRGGYHEWCAEQERQLHLATLQDHLTDYLRKNDAAQLPEVGLQVAATQLSLSLIQPDAARQLAADPEKYSRVVDMLCRLSTQIQALQKDRNEAVRKAGFLDTAERIRLDEIEEAEITRRCYTGTCPKGPRDPDMPHRNELPRRDQLPYKDPI
jgi:hypothetical protein